MSAALLQGVPATTLDADLWINLPERQYVKLLGLCQKLGATILAKTVVALVDDTLVNFLYASTVWRASKRNAQGRWNSIG